jgi:hypothetical protein
MTANAGPATEASLADDAIRPRPLLLVGSKRSGTSHLTRLLNLHPDVFVSHESDVVWILYQLQRQVPYRCYPWDGPLGMTATLAACGELLNNPGAAAVSIEALFVKLLRHLMTQGSAVQLPYPKKRRLQWIGDKKPVQQCDPQLRAFIQCELPTTKFLHIVRHPHAVVSSMLTAAQTWGPVDYWRESSVEQLLERWTVHEEWVLQMKQDPRVDILSVRFEDLAAAPRDEMQRVLTFLDLPFQAAMADRVCAATRPPATAPPAIDTSGQPRLDAIMRLYQYR